MLRYARSSQTSSAEFLDLNELQAAALRQQQELEQLREELTVAQGQAAAALSATLSDTEAERDERWASKMRHLERTHAKALEQTRAAAEAQTAAELAKQKEQLQQQIGKELEDSLAKREAELQRARRELDELRNRVGRRDEQLADLQQQVARKRAALEEERDRTGELEVEQQRLLRERDERQTREGEFVEIEKLRTVEAQIIDLREEVEECSHAQVMPLTLLPITPLLP